MSESFDMIIRRGKVATPAGLVKTDIGVRGGRIAALGDFGSAAGGSVLDAKGLHVLPGVIDTQVHFREPGSEAKEDLGTGTAAAALGGVCAVFDMPNNNPLITDTEAYSAKWRNARGRLWCDAAFYVGATATNVNELAELERLPGCCGVKIFMGSSTGNLLVDDDATLARVLAQGSRRCSVHSEDEERLKERFGIAEKAGDVSAHPEWRDVECAVKSTQRLLKLAHAARRRVHVLHVSTAEELDILRGREDTISVEATPQHLTLAAPEVYEQLGAFGQMNPPIRDARHRDALWQAVNDGLIDCLGSDHAPHLVAEKEAPYPKSPSGMPGVQTLVPVMLDHVNAGRLSLERFVDLMASGPARLFGIAGKGRIAPGFDGDFTIVDLKAKRTITNSWIASRCGWTPYDGMKVKGWPITTVLRGEIIMHEGGLLGEPQGDMMRFLETY
ncbi:MAG: dihydroorotase [Rhodospirillales bacterium]|jgi:dihydroorotase|nr:dihydroorotase [Rhodospirillales bacterium]